MRLSLQNQPQFYCLVAGFHRFRRKVLEELRIFRTLIYLKGIKVEGNVGEKKDRKKLIRVVWY
ncbi:MAG: hypothetical protein JWR87_1719 [Segetibacter sp.]|jgi:hypothetical protein|nr:hypothetical protein [Segetibacter sp.]